MNDRRPILPIEFLKIILDEEKGGGVARLETH